MGGYDLLPAWRFLDYIAIPTKHQQHLTECIPVERYKAYLTALCS